MTIATPACGIFRGGGFRCHTSPRVDQKKNIPQKRVLVFRLTPQLKGGMFASPLTDGHKNINVILVSDGAWSMPRSLKGQVKRCSHTTPNTDHYWNKRYRLSRLSRLAVQWCTEFRAAQYMQAMCFFCVQLFHASALCFSLLTDKNKNIKYSAR